MDTNPNQAAPQVPMQKEGKKLDKAYILLIEILVVFTVLGVIYWFVTRDKTEYPEEQTPVVTNSSTESEEVPTAGVDISSDVAEAVSIDPGDAATERLPAGEETVVNPADGFYTNPFE